MSKTMSLSKVDSIVYSSVDPTPFYVDDNTASAAGVSVGELYLRGATIETAVLSVRMV